MFYVHFFFKFILIYVNSKYKQIQVRMYTHYFIFSFCLLNCVLLLLFRPYRNMEKTYIEEYPSRPRRFGQKVWNVFRRHVLIISTVTAAVLGFGFGLAIRHAHPSQNALIWIGSGC